MNDRHRRRLLALSAFVPCSSIEWRHQSSYSGSMKKASITDAKNNLSALIAGLEGGSPVLIVDRGRPVARLEAVTALGRDSDGRLSRLVRSGVVRPARAAPRGGLVSEAPARAKAGGSAPAGPVRGR